MQKISFYIEAEVLAYRALRLPLCLEGKTKLHHVVTLDSRLPRVDIHVHLAVDPVRDPAEPKAAERFHNVLSGTLDAYKNVADAIIKCELSEIEALMGRDPLGSADVARLVRHGLLNEAYQNVPAVLGAACWGGKSQDEPLNRPAIIVALVADFSQTPVLRDGGDASARFSLAARSALFAYLGVTVAPSKWYGTLPPQVTSVGWMRTGNDEAVDVLETALEEHRWLTRVSGGAVVAFAGYDPRTPRALDRLKQWVLTSKTPGKGLLGIKCYSRCGWSATNNAALYGREGDDVDAAVYTMVDWAVQENIPVTNHHTPGGWPAAGQLIPPKGAKGLLADPRVPALVGVPGTAKWLVSLAAAETAAQCAYVAHTAAPDIWRSLLRIRRFKNLRVNLAHAGTAAAGLCRYGLLDPAELLNAPVSRPEVKYLIQWPPAGGKDYFHLLFPLAVVSRLRAITDRVAGLSELSGNSAPIPSELPGLMFAAAPFSATARPLTGESWNSARAVWTIRENRLSLEEMTSSLRELLDDSDWKSWMSDFSQMLGADWLTQCLDLADEFPNVYTDISYFSADTITFSAVLRRLFKEIYIDHPSLGKKMMFGTDWFVTEAERVSAWTFLSIVRTSFEAALPDGEDHWEDFTSRNALRFLDLGSRFDQWESFFKMGKAVEGDLKVGLQPWWRNVKQWYRHQSSTAS